MKLKTMVKLKTTVMNDIAILLFMLGGFLMVLYGGFVLDFKLVSLGAIINMLGMIYQKL